MQIDGFGQTVSLPSAEAATAWTHLQYAFLAHSASAPEHLAKTLETSPNFALGHAVKGLFCILLGRRELYATAAESLKTARAAVARTGATRREALYVEALAACVNGRPTAAIATLSAVLAAHPDDPLAMKLDHGLRFVLGDNHGMRRSLESVRPAYSDDHPALGYLLGCYAFALEETGDYAEAAATGRAALDRAPDDAWGLHAVAHVHDMTGDAFGGLNWLSGRENAWAHCNNFRFHVWWHKALMHLDLGQVDAVFALYDDEIRSEKTDDYRDISNATSLLMRLELEGVNVGDRWRELADLSAARTEDGCLIFADLHYLLALVGDDRKQAQSNLIARIHADAQRASVDSDAAMASPGMSAAIGLEAFGDGRYAHAFLALSTAHTHMQQAGGSHAQRDVFERLAIDAGIRAGFFAQAGHLLADRTAKRAGTVDGYAAARHALIEAGRADAAQMAQPAE